MTKIDPHPQEALRPLALLALGKTGADIERLVREVRRTTKRSGRTMSWADLDAALRVEQTAMSADFRRRASIHEAGHALVYTVTGVAEVQSASIGLHGVGMVTTIRNSSLPQTEAWLMNTIACILAGRAAELLVIGEVVAGGGGADESDLARATMMALAAETSLGFSTHQPLVYRSVAMGANQLTLDRELAERVNLRLERAEAIARQMIEANRATLEGMASCLEKVGILSGDEVRQLLACSSGIARTSDAPPGKEIAIPDGAKPILHGAIAIPTSRNAILD